MPSATSREFDPAELGRAIYRMLNSVVVPRPIAWVSSQDAAGTLNLAPHSYFTVSSVLPPVVQFTSVGTKDSLRNIRATGEFVVHVVTRELAELCNVTATDYPADHSEFVAAALTTTPSRTVAVPRLAESPVAIECTLAGEKSFGSATVVFGQVQWLAVHEAVLGDDGLADIGKLAPVSRLGHDELGHGGRGVLPAPGSVRRGARGRGAALSAVADADSPGPSVRAAATRAGLLTAAREVFASKGYADASVVDVVARAGASVGSLYHHFDGKADLYLALFDDYARRQIERPSAAGARREHSTPGVGRDGPVRRRRPRVPGKRLARKGSGPASSLPAAVPPGFELVARRRHWDWVRKNQLLLPPRSSEETDALALVPDRGDGRGGAGGRARRRRRAAPGRLIEDVLAAGGEDRPGLSPRCRLMTCRTSRSMNPTTTRCSANSGRPATAAATPAGPTRIWSAPATSSRSSRPAPIWRTTPWVRCTATPPPRLAEFTGLWATEGVRACEVWQPKMRAVADLVGQVIGAPPGTTVLRQNVADLVGAIASCLDFHRPAEPDRVRRRGRMARQPLPVAGASALRGAGAPGHRV